MQRKRFIIQALSAVVLVWSLVFTVQSWASSRKITAERLRQTIQKTALADWSQGEGTATEAGKRRETIREIADITNRLDFQEREKN